MSSDPILYISLPKDDFADLSNGLYKLNFSRQVDDVATKDPPVWAYKQLDTPTVVTAFQKEEVTSPTPGIKLSVPLTSLLGSAGDIKYHLSYLKTSDNLAGVNLETKQIRSNKKLIEASIGQGDSLGIVDRAIPIVESESYEIKVDGKVGPLSNATKSWADSPWTVGLKNMYKVRPIILREDCGKFSVYYLTPTWWTRGKGRLSLPQEDKVSIWFANKTKDTVLDIEVEDFSDPKVLTLKRGKTYNVPYSQDDRWKDQELVAEE